MRIFAVILIVGLLIAFGAMPVSASLNAREDQQSMELAWASYDTKFYDVARNEAQDTLKRNPNNIDACHLLGLIQFKTGNLKKSIYYLERARELVLKKNIPNSDVMDAQLGLVYFKNKQYEKALENFKAAKQNNPIPITEAKIAMTLWQIGKMKDGLESMHHSKALGITQADFLEFLEEYAIDAKDFEQLIRVLK